MASPSNDYSNFQVGGAYQPIATTTAESLLIADPAIYYALDFWTWVINTYPGAHILQAFQLAGRSDIQYAVAQAYPTDATLEFLETQAQFPLLFVYRTRSTYKRKTAGYEHDRGLIQVCYALPTLTPGQAEIVAPCLRSVAAAIRKKTTQGGDLNYAPPGGAFGQQPWGPSFANLEEAGFDGDEYGGLEGSTGNMYFRTLRMDGYLLERYEYVPAANKYAGADITGNVQNVTVVQVSTQLAPSISLLTPNTGPIAGGTVVIITGALFLNGQNPGTPWVTFGSAPATNVSWVSATSLTCTTPAMGALGPVDVVVNNRDGQSARAANGFTYS